MINDAKNFLGHVLSSLTFKLFNFLHLKEPSAILIWHRELHTCPRKFLASLIISVQSSTEVKVPSSINFCTSDGRTISIKEHRQRSFTNFVSFSFNFFQFTSNIR